MKTLMIFIILAIVIAIATVLYFVFKNKKQKKEKVPEPVPASNPIARIFAPKEKTLGVRNYPRHNNRKNTKGRHIQYVELNGITKPIYHGAK